jgi:hypothetical protein
MGRTERVGIKMAESTRNNNDLDKELDKALIQGLYQENEELKTMIKSLEKELWEVGQDKKVLKEELIHYLGELKMLYTRQDSKRFCEEKIHKLKNS